ncbi:hypothetical protein RhiJN_23515 [Ceratobasidium sp. AG-Ba]|nr:hypothetical protein RhiJN_23515 [Ceratobasidium sp. AG-Ba]
MHKVGPLLLHSSTGSESDSEGTLHNTCEISQGDATAPAGSATFSSYAPLHHTDDTSEAYLNSSSLAFQETPFSPWPGLEAGVLDTPAVDQGSGVGLPTCQSFQLDLAVYGMGDSMAELASHEQMFPATTFDPYEWGAEYHTTTNDIQSALDAFLGQGMLYINT